MEESASASNQEEKPVKKPSILKKFIAFACFVLVLSSLGCAGPQTISSVQPLTAGSTGIVSAGTVGERNPVSFSVMENGGVLVIRYSAQKMLNSIVMTEQVSGRGTEVNTILDLRNVQNCTLTYNKPPVGETKRFKLVTSTSGSFGGSDEEVIEVGLFFGNKLMQFDLGMNMLAALAQQSMMGNPQQLQPAQPQQVQPTPTLQPQQNPTPADPQVTAHVPTVPAPSGPLPLSNPNPVTQPVNPTPPAANPATPEPTPTLTAQASVPTSTPPPFASLATR